MESTFVGYQRRHGVNIHDGARVAEKEEEEEASHLMWFKFGSNHHQIRILKNIDLASRTIVFLMSSSAAPASFRDRIPVLGSDELLFIASAITEVEASTASHCFCRILGLIFPSAIDNVGWRFGCWFLGQVVEGFFFPLS